MKRAWCLLALLLLPSVARAQDLRDRFNIRLSLTGFYLAEQQDIHAGVAHRADRVLEVCVHSQPSQLRLLNTS